MRPSDILEWLMYMANDFFNENLFRLVSDDILWWDTRLV